MEMPGRRRTKHSRCPAGGEARGAHAPVVREPALPAAPPPPAHPSRAHLRPQEDAPVGQSDAQGFETSCSRSSRELKGRRHWAH